MVDRETYNLATQYLAISQQQMAIERDRRVLATVLDQVDDARWCYELFMDSVDDIVLTKLQASMYIISEDGTKLW